MADLRPSSESWNDLGDFDLVRKVGRGGVGVVFEAQQKSLQRRVALKVLHDHIAWEPEAVEHFETEARTLGRVRHPHVVEVHDVGRANGLPYLVMEFLSGESLEQRLEQLRNVPIDERTAQHLGDSHSAQYEHAAIRLVVRVLKGVGAIHAQGIVHRDLKPANLIYDAAGVVKIADFGLARDLAEATEGTVSGALYGTPSYMSPEQASGNLLGLDHRSDLFSVGVILFELLSGTRPFGEGSWQAQLRTIVTTSPMPLRKLNRRISRDVERVVQRSLEKNFENRYANADEFADDLENALLGQPIARGRPTFRDRCRRVWSRQTKQARLGAPLLYVAWLPMWYGPWFDDAAIGPPAVFLGGTGLLLCLWSLIRSPRWFPACSILIFTVCLVFQHYPVDAIADEFDYGDDKRVIEICQRTPVDELSASHRLMFVHALWREGLKADAHEVAQAMTMPPGTDPRQLAQLRRWQARLLWRHGEPAAALALLKEEDLNPESYVEVDGYGGGWIWGAWLEPRALVGLGRYDEALKVAKKVNNRWVLDYLQGWPDQLVGRHCAEAYRVCALPSGSLPLPNGTLTDVLAPDADIEWQPISDAIELALAEPKTADRDLVVALERWLDRDWVAAAKIAFLRDDLEGAQRHANRALGRGTLGPPRSDAYEVLTRIALKRDDLEAARKWAELSFRFSDGLADVLRTGANLQKVYAQCGLNDKASALQAQISAYPDVNSYWADDFAELLEHVIASD